MSAENVEIVRRLFADFEAGDIDAVFAAFDPAIEWIEPQGYFTGAGGVRGVEAVGAVLSVYPETWSEFALEPDRFLDAGDDVIVTGVQRGVSAATGRRFEARFCNVWTLAGGRVTRFEGFSDTLLVQQAIGGGGSGT